MPKFIGNKIHGAQEIEPNADHSVRRIKLSFSQAALLPNNEVICSLDTTDKGSKKSYAKRWYRWFASPQSILTSKKSTPKMKQKAIKAITAVIR